MARNRRSVRKSSRKRRKSTRRSKKKDNFNLKKYIVLNQKEVNLLYDMTKTVFYLIFDQYMDIFVIPTSIQFFNMESRSVYETYFSERCTCIDVLSD